MAFVPVPNVAEVELRYLLDSQHVENTLYYGLSTTVTLADLQALAADVAAVMVSSVMPLLSSFLTLNEIVVTDLSSSTGDQVSYNTGLPLAGSQTGDYLPANVAFAIGFKTTVRGRSYRGRNYVVGLVESQANGNHIDATTRTNLVNAWQDLGAAGVPDAWTHVVVSRFTAGAPRVTGVATVVTEYVTYDDVFDSQRRRLPGRGR